jgi:hypothetical protein
MSNYEISRRLFLGAMAAPLWNAQANPTATRHLFLNSGIVESTNNLALRVGRVVKDARNPLFKEDKPWEVRYDNVYANVMYDSHSKLYRCWYSPFIVDPAVSESSRSDWGKIEYRPRSREMGVCYAESSDGLSWRKPELGLVEFQGNTAKNLVVRGPHGSGVSYDPYDKDPARRYKMFFLGRALSASFSTDGIHWGSAVPLPSLKAAADTHNNAQWMPRLNRYVGITRLFDREKSQRLVARTESENFLDWTPPQEVLRCVENAPENQTYAMPIFEYGDVYLGSVMIFNKPSDTVWCELPWSPDTIKWERIDIDTPLIPLGANTSYDCGCVYAAAKPIVTEKEILLYYGASNGPHTGWRDGFFCLSRLRLDGFAGLTATYGKGTVVTKPIQVTSPNLRINAEAASGAIRVGVLNADTCQLEKAVPVRSDSVDSPVTWNGSDLSSLIGKKVQFVFELESAKAYSFSFV